MVTNQELQKKLKAYETFREKINSRSSNLWILASVFISVSWLVFAQGVISAESMSVFKLFMTSIASISSCFFLSVYTCHTHRNNELDKKGLEEMEEDLDINVYGYEKDKIVRSRIRGLAHNAIYILTGIIFAAWIVFIYDNFLNTTLFSTIILSASYYLTSLPDPKIFFFWLVIQTLVNQQHNYPLYFVISVIIVGAIIGLFVYSEKIKEEGRKPTIYMFKGENDRKIIVFVSGENVYCYDSPQRITRNSLSRLKKNKRFEIWIKKDC